MITLFKNRRILVIIFSFVFSLFSPLSVNPAFAFSYTYNCDSSTGGGTITSLVDIIDGSTLQHRDSFLANTPTNFYASGQVTNNCSGDKTITMTSQQDNNPIAIGNLINNAVIHAGQFFPNNYLPVLFQYISPSAAGQYVMHFITNVDESATTPAPIYVRQSSQYTITDSGTCYYSIPFSGNISVPWQSTRTDYYADFYSDAAGTIPMTVNSNSGLSISYTGTPTGSTTGSVQLSTPVSISGQSFNYDSAYKTHLYCGYGYGDSAVPDGWSTSQYSSFTVNNGAGLAIPYTLLN